jgi:diadenosine tetraphosphate (Ap4A) HIT family hydrolase
MSHQACVFCNIVEGKIPATKIYENDRVLVIKDIAPKAPVHLLIIPKVHLSDVAALTEAHAPYVTAALRATAELQKQLSGSQSFRLITNTGADAGQSVFHLHFHFLSGKKMLDL